MAAHGAPDWRTRLSSARCGESPPTGLIEGVRLFNDRDFFACHEVLELAWRAESDPVRALYQGILQIGVGFYHLGRRNWRGAVKLLEGGIAKVRQFLPACMGVDTARLVAESERCLEVLRALGRERLDAFDWSLVPSIQLKQDIGTRP
jgi:predicted metal-dependent hydrolase